MNVMNYISTLLLAVPALFLVTACSKVTEDNLQKVHTGMSSQEVKAILGEPTSSSTSSPLGIVTGTVYTYHSDATDVKIRFVDDKVIDTEGDFK
jgi:hypothetical protein